MRPNFHIGRVANFSQERRASRLARLLMALSALVMLALGALVYHLAAGMPL